MDAANNHGYPLYAKITFSALGDNQVVYTNPITGAYEVGLPIGHQYTAKVESMINGYEVVEEAFTPDGQSEFVKNFAVPINSQTCIAPGYGKVYDVAFYDFETDPQGFTFGGNNSSWAHGQFTPIPNAPARAHSGNYGIATNPAGLYGVFESSWAASPVIDLSGVPSDKAVVLEWWQWLYTGVGGWDEASVEFTKDGITWTPVLGPFQGQDKDWKLEKLIIDPEYYTEKFQFRFWFHSDSYGEYPGWYIDDIGLGLVEGVPPATPVKTYNFDGADDGEWTTGSTGPGANSWAKGVPTTGPGEANTLPNVWATNLNGFYNLDEVSYITSPVIDMSEYAGGAIEVKYFDWLETESAVAPYDVARIKATSNGTTWDTIVDNMLRQDDYGAAMSAQKIVLGSKYTTDKFQFRFEFKSDDYDADWLGWYIDSVQFGATEAFQSDVPCGPQNGGVVAGYAIDNWKDEKLYDVKVESDNVLALPKQSTDDPAADGLYWLFQPNTGTGATQTIAFTASKDKFDTLTDNVSVKKSEIVRKDWKLNSGFLVATPEALEQTITLFDDPVKTTLNIENLGSIDANFSLNEFDTGFQPYSIPPFTGEIQSSEPTSLRIDPGLSTKKAGTEREKNGESIILEGGSQAFAIEIRQAQMTLKNIPDITVPETWANVANMSTVFFAGDFLKDDYSKMYAVSEDNAFVTIDMETGAITPIAMITVPGNSVEGISGADGFFYGIANNQIFTLDTEGNVEVIASPSFTAGIDIAYVPDNGLLYVVDLQTDHLFSVNPKTGETIDVGALGFNASFAQGMDYDEASKVLYWAAYGGGGDGHLRAIDMNTGNSALVGPFPGDNETDCLAIAAYGGDSVPWLSETPEEGIVPALDDLDIEIEFSVDGIEQPGDYSAQLRIINDTPHTLSIPVTMHVVRPLDWGNIKANVYTLEQCDISPAPANKIAVNFYQNGQRVGSTKTDADGYFSYALEQGSYDVEVLKPGYVTQTINDVLVVGDEDTNLDDINIRLDAACLTFEPKSIKQSQLTDTITEQTLTFTNTGAKETVFEIREKDLGGPTRFAMTDDDNLILDPGFEAYTPSPYWDEFSAAFDTPLCTASDCGTGGGSGPHTGLAWTWFGGVRPGDFETAYVSQEVVIPSGSAIMRFWLEQSACGDGGANSYLALEIDGQELWRTDGTNPACNKLGYREIEVNVSEFANDQSHEIKFNGSFDGEANFFLDDVELTIGTGTGGDILWLDIDVLADVVMPGQSVDVTLTFDSTDLLLGDYIGELVITNAPNPRFNIPVRLRVQGISDIYLPLISNSNLFLGN